MMVMDFSNQWWQGACGLMLKVSRTRSPEAAYLYTSIMCIAVLCDQVWVRKQRSFVTLKAPFQDDCVTRSVTGFKVL